MSLDLQLMAHSQLETHDDENRSKTNRFECDMVLGLVRYLLVHGYGHEQITVLAMYSGQQFLIKQKMRELNVAVRVTSVDNYQGEENDVVVISFVRSNEEGKIGFLRTLNRVRFFLGQRSSAISAEAMQSKYAVVYVDAVVGSRLPPVRYIV